MNRFADQRAVHISATLPYVIVTPPEIHSRLARYGLAVLTIGLATLVSLLFRPLFERNPFVLFWAAVILSAWFGDLGPGLLATVLTVVAVNVFFQRPYGEAPLAPINVIPLSIFVLLSVAMSWLHERRRQLESAIYRQGEWFRTTLHSIGDGVIVTDAQSKIVFMNPMAEELTGWSEKDAFGQPIQSVFRIVNEQTRLPVENPVSRVLELGVILGLANHTVLIAKDGTERAIDDSGAPIRDDRGQVAGAILVFRDVSERREQERALQKSEELFRLASEALQGTVYDADLRTGTARRSSGITDLTGYPLGDIPPTNSWWDELVHPDDRARVAQVFADHVARRAPIRGVEYRIRTKSGRYLWMWDLARILYEDGEPVRMVGTTISIEERKQLEESLKRSEAQARAQLAEIEAIYRGAPVGLAVIDRDMRFVRVNQHLAELNGVPPEAHIGRTIREVVPALAEEAERLVQTIIQTGQPLLDLEIRGETAAQPGVERIWLEQWTPIKGDNAQVVGVNVVAEEITERKRLEQEAQEAAASRERARLARDLHDAVSQALFSASIIAEALPQQWERNPEKALGLLEQLRTLTRGAQAEMRTLLLELRPTVLDEADLKTLVSLLADAARSRKRVDLAVSLDDCVLPLDVKIAFYRIAQEALNNVVKHSRAEHAEVSVRSRDNETELTITDDGRGFDLDTVATTSLGLKIMRERAAAINADLQLFSEPDRGTLVRVIWRADRAVAQTQT